MPALKAQAVRLKRRAAADRTIVVRAEAKRAIVERTRMCMVDEECGVGYERIGRKETLTGVAEGNMEQFAMLACKS